MGYLICGFIFLIFGLLTSFFSLISKFQFLFLFLRSLPGDLSFGILFIWKLHQVHILTSWFSGILLLFLLMAIAFVGYVLPFGQMSFWGATVISNLLSPFPSLVEWVCGGYCVHNPTLKRFFLFH